MEEGIEKNDSKKYAPGDVVETSSGVGVVLRCPNKDEDVTSYQVLLGRIPGKSIATADVKLLQADEVRGMMCVAFFFVS